MTVVLPAPVASFSASRISSGFASALAAFEVVEESLARLPMRRDLGQPDRRLDRLDLAEERPDAAELVVAPVLEEPRGLRRDLPLAGSGSSRQASTCCANFVDDRGGVVLLLLRRKALALVEHELLLTAAPPLLRLRDRRDELGPPPRVDERPVGWPVSSSSQCRRGYS